MNSTYTDIDVIKLLNSVITVSVEMYPKSYKTDAEFLKMLKPTLKEQSITIKKKVNKFQLSYNNIICAIDRAAGTEEYLNEFYERFDTSKGIEANYAELVSRYSSAEIILLFHLFPNIVYFDFTVYNTPDARAERTKNITCLKLPDATINTLSLKLRDYCEQNVVDWINKFIIEHDMFDDNAMSKRNVFMLEHVYDFFTFLDIISKDHDYNSSIIDFIEKLKFLDLNEISNSGLIVTTDWNIL